MSSGQYALLLTDLVDSTRAVERLGDAAASRLWEAHDRLARDLLRRWRGREIDKSDGFLLLFDEVADAAGFALDYHRALAALPEPLYARAGLHVGELLLRETPPDHVALGAKPIEVDGLAKPLAARVMALARAGQTLLTAEARARLSPPAVSIGHWQVKGMEQPVELFSLDDGNADAHAPIDGDKGYRVIRRDGMWVPLREVRNSLPAERDVFIGRPTALAALASKFRQDGARLVTVVGVGGTGKTRLALRYARTQLGDHAGGVWFCDLSQARDADGVARAVAQGLDVPLGKSDPTEQLGAALSGRRRCLVLLDNCEQVARAAGELLGTWLDRAPEAHFIATSREVLGVAGEQVLMLDPMSIAEGSALFRLRSASAGMAAPLDDPDIDPLVRLLDGLPLAIELAAARARVMSPHQLLQRMSERFSLLARRHGRGDRQSTLRAAFDWSWDLLSAAEKAALAQLSVFEGRAAWPAAEAALALPADGSPVEVIDVLQSLVEKSLLRHRGDDAFDMLGTVQAYAAERLRSSGDSALADAQRRHAAYFAALGPARAIDDRCADIDNLIAAARRASAMGAVALAVDALEGAWSALRLRGPYRLGNALTGMVRDMPGLDARARARVGRMRGWVLEACGDVGPAKQAFDEALASAREAGDRACEAQVLAHLGDRDTNGGENERARSQFETALSLAREVGDMVVECHAHSGLGNLHAFQGRFADARREFDAALVAARAAGDRRWEGGSLGNLGLNCYYQGQMAPAHAFYEAALAIARDLGDRQREGNTLCNIGILHWTEGRHAEARVELDLALAVARDMGHARLECVVLCNLGLVVEALQEPEEARKHFETALHVAIDLGDRRSQGQVLGYLGVLHARQGRHDEARTCLEEGHRLLVEVGDLSSLGVLSCGQAEALRRAGDLDEAKRALARAMALADEIKAEPESEFGQALALVVRLVSD